jgi:hypothetical protein
MAKKIEQWVDNEGDECMCELSALCADLWIAERASTPESEAAELNADVTAAIDALHEYAHRGELVDVIGASANVIARVVRPDVKDTGTVLPEGVPPELDDWVKRWEWITARVTEADCEKLNEADEVRIGLNWFPVRYRGTLIVCIKTSDVGEVAFSFVELAAIANEVRYNGR